MISARAETILLIEDDQADVEMALHAINAKAPSLNVVVAKNGYEALTLISSVRQQGTNFRLENLKAIFLDLHMPGLDGFEVLHRIKTDAATKILPVIIFTSSLEPKDIERCYALGANSYVAKPIEVEEYDRVVKEAMSYWLLVNQTTSPQVSVVVREKDQV
ncbi:MAG TPA: response regulator [Bacteroidota bacterium]|nr:response regulator [Bacteroidota bacterium]